MAAAASPDSKGLDRAALAFLDGAAELAQSSGLAGAGGSAAALHGHGLHLLACVLCSEFHLSSAPLCARRRRAAPCPALLPLRPASARAGVLVLNGVVAANEGGGWQGATMGAVQQQLQAVQEDVYMGRLTDGSRDLYEGAPWGEWVAGWLGGGQGSRA